MKKQYWVINLSDDEYDSHDYTIIDDTTSGVREITLYRSNSRSWTEKARGTKLLTLTNDGNKIVLDKKIKELDYEELVELRILLSFEVQTDSELNKRGFKIVNVDNPINIT